MKRIVLLSLLLVFLSAFGAAAANVNVTIVPNNTAAAAFFLGNPSAFALEVGFAVSPQLELVGRLWGITEYFQDEGEEAERSHKLYPGFGFRYNVWSREQLTAYGLGSFSWLVDSDSSDKENYLKGGLGVAYRFNENYALVGEAGVQRATSEDEEYIEKTTFSYADLGVRVYF